MAIAKVLGLALAFGILFLLTGMALLEGIEKSAGRSATVVIIGLGCVGLLLGAIVGAAQAVVDAVQQTRQSGRHPD